MCGRRRPGSRRRLGTDADISTSGSPFDGRDLPFGVEAVGLSFELSPRSDLARCRCDAARDEALNLS